MTTPNDDFIQRLPVVWFSGYINRAGQWDLAQCGWWLLGHAEGHAYPCAGPFASQQEAEAAQASLPPCPDDA
jgi:hypothetical protein